MPIALPDPLPPLPPDELIGRVMPHFGPDQAEEVRSTYHAHGEITVRSQERALAAVGREFASFERLLDFGCGPGRALGLMGALAPDVELHGVDIDRDAIDWAAARHPFAQWHVGPQEPPLAFPDGHFDLVVNHSVFTHLDERMQDLWLAELQRVARPGAILLLTVHGETMIAPMLRDLAGGGDDPAPYLRTLRERGILFIEDDGYVGSVHPPYYHSAYHAPWYIYAHWGTFFSVRALLSPGAWGGHDVVVLERTGDDVPEVAPIVPATLAEPDGSPAPALDNPDRRERMLRLGLYQQGERLTLVERELRARIEALEQRLPPDA
jgi:SAM-dependent methyltransferase